MGEAQEARSWPSDRAHRGTWSNLFADHKWFYLEAAAVHKRGSGRTRSGRVRTSRVRQGNISPPGRDFWSRGEQIGN